MKLPGRPLLILPFLLLATLAPGVTLAQQPAEKPPEKKAEKEASPEKAENPAQIELLETRYRFEGSGDSRKEVHAQVHINSELGVRQFARLNFDYNRSFESVEIPLVHITHPGGGTADILPSAITDQPNPAVVNAPAYQDVRVKSVRILGLEPGDHLEYRVITTISHHPLAPAFWLDHSFDRTGVVSRELFDVDVPASRKIQLHVAPEFPYEIIESESRTDARVVYRWQHSMAVGEGLKRESVSVEPALALTTFSSWDSLSNRLADLVEPPRADTGGRRIATEVSAKGKVLTEGRSTCAEKIEAIYDFVSQKIVTVDLPIGSTGFRTRSEAEILSSGYGNAEDKFKLFAALVRPFTYPPVAFLSGAPDSAESQLPRPSQFTHLLVTAADEKRTLWLDPGAEVAPFGSIPSSFRGKRAFGLDNTPPEDLGGIYWKVVPADLPFASVQRVTVEAILATDGKLSAKVHYALRGDNELLLRVAFHQAPKEKWKDLAQLLSLSDGFRGQVSSVKASDPYATREPFAVDYEITQPKFVDWSKKPVRIPALLPQLGLPDPPAKPAAGTATSPLELGAPLEVETRMTLHLPPGTTATAPPSTSVQRDYATFASEYSAKGLTITASRHVHFMLSQLPADRAADYNAFLRAVLNDEAQDFSLDRGSPPAPAAKPASH
jgi:Domain of Unknown Function with PDB structure (DUF3857)